MGSKEVRKILRKLRMTERYGRVGTGLLLAGDPFASLRMTGHVAGGHGVVAGR
jgi:hypothetical protein